MARHNNAFPGELCHLQKHSLQAVPVNEIVNKVRAHDGNLVMWSTGKPMIALNVNPFRSIKWLENFGCLETSKQFTVLIILRNVAVAATAVKLAVITAHVVIIVAIKHALYCN